MNKTRFTSLQPRTDVALCMLLLFLFLPYIICADEKKTFSTTASLCRWDDTRPSVDMKITAHGICLTKLPQKELNAHDHLILEYLLGIDDTALNEVELYGSDSDDPYRDFLFYKGSLCAVSQRNEASTPEKYHSQFSLLKERYGIPDTKRTKKSVTHTFADSDTTVVYRVERRDEAMRTEIFLYPADLFKRLLSK